MTFLTEYKQDGKTYCGRVKANTWDEAQRIATEKGKPGEMVIGTLVMEHVLSDAQAASVLEAMV